jgi:hypothetical protein
MSQDFLIGVLPNSTDPFWVQVEEAVRQQAGRYPVELVTISADGVADPPTPERQLALIEELLALELNALVGWWFPETMAIPVLDAGLPIIHLSETEVSHPLSVSPRGLYDVGRMAAVHLAERLGGQGRVLVDSFQIYARIAMPLAKPIVVTVIVLEFLAAWTSFLEPLIYLNSQDKYTVALGLSLLRSGFSGRIEWGLMMAATALSALPPLIIFFLAQKQLIGGIAVTGIKG